MSLYNNKNEWIMKILPENILKYLDYTSIDSKHPLLPFLLSQNKVSSQVFGYLTHYFNILPTNEQIVHQELQLIANWFDSNTIQDQYNGKEKLIRASLNKYKTLKYQFLENQFIILVKRIKHIENQLQLLTSKKKILNQKEISSTELLDEPQLLNYIQKQLTSTLQNLKNLPFKQNQNAVIINSDSEQEQSCQQKKQPMNYNQFQSQSESDEESNDNQQEKKQKTPVVLASQTRKKEQLKKSTKIENLGKRRLQKIEDLNSETPQFEDQSQVNQLSIPIQEACELYEPKTKSSQQKTKQEPQSNKVSNQKLTENDQSVNLQTPKSQVPQISSVQQTSKKQTQQLTESPLKSEAQQNQPQSQSQTHTQKKTQNSTITKTSTQYQNPLTLDSSQQVINQQPHSIQTQQAQTQEPSTPSNEKIQKQTGQAEPQQFSAPQTINQQNLNAQDSTKVDVQPQTNQYSNQSDQQLFQQQNVQISNQQFSTKQINKQQTPIASLPQQKQLEQQTESLIPSSKPNNQLSSVAIIPQKTSLEQESEQVTNQQILPLQTNQKTFDASITEQNNQQQLISQNSNQQFSTNSQNQVIQKIDQIPVQKSEELELDSFQLLMKSLQSISCTAKFDQLSNQNNNQQQNPINQQDQALQKK